MGAVFGSRFDVDEHAKVSWRLPNSDEDSQWHQFVAGRYSHGLGATGVPMNAALRPLLRRKLNGWRVAGMQMHVGPGFVAFGRHLTCDGDEDGMIFGTILHFGTHDQAADQQEAGAICDGRDWFLKLHHVALEPLSSGASGGGGAALATDGGGLPDASAPITHESLHAHRWLGQPRLLVEGTGGVRPVAARERSSSSSAPPSPRVQEAACEAAGEGTEAGVRAADSGSHVEARVRHQLNMFLSNADGHVGLLSVPVPEASSSEVQEVIAHWDASCKVPLSWGGERWKTAEDFRLLQESAIVMPDLLLFGLEPEHAMALTPDTTWDKYPRGHGRVVPAATLGAPEGDPFLLEPAVTEQREQCEAVTAEEVSPNPGGEPA